MVLSSIRDIKLKYDINDQRDFHEDKIGDKCDPDYDNDKVCDGRISIYGGNGADDIEAGRGSDQMDGNWGDQVFVNEDSDGDEAHDCETINEK